MQILRASRGKSIALFFFAKKKRGTKEKTIAYDCLLGSNVLPLLLRNSRFTLIPPKIYDIKAERGSRAAGYVLLCADGIKYLSVCLYGRPCVAARRNSLFHFSPYP